MRSVTLFTLWQIKSKVCRLVIYQVRYQPNTMQNVMKIDEFLASDIVDTPERPGIYAWYYRPLAFGKGTRNVAEIMGKLITDPTRVKTDIAMRYGLTWAVDSDIDVLYGAERKPAKNVLSEAVASGSDLIKSFLQNLMVPYFAKPLYIGIDTKNLRRRIKEHYDLLDQLWNPNSGISKYLTGHRDATLKEVLKELSLTHSFAVEARIKEITLRDLVVCVYQFERLDNPDELKKLEHILQLLADPICGRR